MNFKKIIINLLMLLIVSIVGTYGQQTLSASGYEASGDGGTSSYIVGQLLYTTNVGVTGSVVQGLEQPIELITLNLEEDLLLIASAKVFPNPTTNKIQIRLDLDDFENLSYQLYDASGRLLQDEKINEATLGIQLSHLTTAIYFLKIRRDNHELKTFRILKN